MEIQRHNDEHLEVILEQSADLSALQAIAQNWMVKCESAKSIDYKVRASDDDSLIASTKEKVTALDAEYSIQIQYADAPADSEGSGVEDFAQKRSHLSDLIMLATVDGQFDPEEDRTILEIGSQLGISERWVNSIYNECVLCPDYIDTAIPESAEERVNYLTDLCKVILADGTIADWESVLVVPLAAKMGFDAEDVSRKIDELLDAGS